MSEAFQNPVGVLAIQGDYAAHQQALRALDVPSILVRKAEQLERISGLILPGGESTTLLKFLEGEGLWEPLRDFAQQHPVFGTCAGAILLAAEVENPAQRSLGLIDISVRRNAFGRQVFSFIRHASLTKSFTAKIAKAAPAEGKIEAVFIRAPLILRTGKSVETLISLDDSPVLVQQGKTLAATFHPELSNVANSDLLVHRYFCSLVTGQMPSIQL